MSKETELDDLKIRIACYAKKQFPATIDVSRLHTLWGIKPYRLIDEAVAELVKEAVLVPEACKYQELNYKYVIGLEEQSAPTDVMPWDYSKHEALEDEKSRTINMFLLKDGDYYNFRICGTHEGQEVGFALSDTCNYSQLGQCLLVLANEVMQWHKHFDPDFKPSAMHHSLLAELPADYQQLGFALGLAIEPDEIQNLILQLNANGYLKIEGDHLHLTERGADAVREYTGSLDS